MNVTSAMGRPQIRQRGGLIAKEVGGCLLPSGTDLKQDRGDLNGGGRAAARRKDEEGRAEVAAMQNERSEGDAKSEWTKTKLVEA